MPRQRYTDHAADLEKAFDRWDQIYNHGCDDPFWPDGINLELVRNHILYHRAQLEETPTLFGFPEIYNREVPPEVPRGYMARVDEIRTAARTALEAYRADPNYQFILAHRDEIPPKACDKMLVGYAMNTVSGLENAIADDILVSMRRHAQPDNSLKTFERCACQIREYLQGESMETVKDPAFDDSDDEDFDEDYEEEPEEELGEMTMTM